ncbi:hypothetical protein SKAU_G00033650 [Synaphobranchus kaupii]|uniref:ABM domain-containing protein n=1 Tax=Synaphobranchus kaupii TaxID=118154 RepID=A0A9Q1JGA3_SYNKA|nr:hypothetical protein SKAU_G00033650 [Synaphobranchus kaupii]
MAMWFDLHQRLTETDGTASASLYLIRQEMSVSQKQLGEFCEALKQYLKNVSAQRDCFHVTAVRLPDGLSFVVYEFWDGEDEWKQHLQTAASKAFQHVKVDTLCQPEAVSTVAVPDLEKGTEKSLAALQVPKSIVATIIRKWKKFGTTKNLPRPGRPGQLSNRGKTGLGQGARTGRLVLIEGKMNAAKYTEILEENLLQSTLDLRLGAKVYLPT